MALALDAVDGHVARATHTQSAFGGRFDGEADAFLLLVLSVHVAQEYGAWVLTIGVARYAFWAAGWVFDWFRRRLPSRPGVVSRRGRRVAQRRPGTGRTPAR